MAITHIESSAKTPLTGGSLTLTLTMPAAIPNGSIAYLIVHWTANVTLTTPTGWIPVAGPTQAGTVLNSYDSLFSRNVGAGDSSSAVLATFSGAVRAAMAVSVVSGGSFDQIAYVGTGTAALTGNVPAFTPITTGNCTALLFAGMSSTTATGVITTTPPATWAEQIDDSTAFGTLVEAATYIASKQLVGQSGIPQAATTMTSNVNHRTGCWVVTFGTAAQPTANFTSSTIGTDVTVDGTSSSAVGAATITGFDWNWGDGSAHGSGSTALHTYATGGTYTVTLTVTDSTSLTGVTSASVTVTTPGTTASYASITASSGWSTTGGTVLSVLTDTASGAPVLSTFAASPTNPVAAELDGGIGPLLAPVSGQPFVAVLYVDRVSSTSGTVSAQLCEGATVRASLSGIAIPDMASTGGTGTATAGTVSATSTVVLAFPWAGAAQNVLDWNQANLKLQFTAS